VPTSASCQRPAETAKGLSTETSTHRPQQSRTAPTMSTAAAIKAPALRAARLTAPARPARTRAPALRATYADYSASQGSSALSGTAAARGQVQAQASPSVLPSPEVLPAPEATASAETEHGVGGWIAALSGLFSSQEVAREPW